MLLKDVEIDYNNDKVDVALLLEILEEKGIKTVEDLMGKSGGCISYKCSCSEDETTFTTYSINYQYKFQDGRFIKCDEEDEDVIYDFVFYVCTECKEVSYYLDIV